MQDVYRRRKDSFDKETDELEGKKQEVLLIRKRVRHIEQQYGETDEIIKLKKEQRDFYLKMISMLEVNYNEYCKHVNELVVMYKEKYRELKLYKDNSSCLSQIFFEAMHENEQVEKQIQEKVGGIGELKQILSLIHI